MSKARPVTRRSISRELFEDRPAPPPPPPTMGTKARPVARRSISRELFDFGNSSVGGARPRKDLPDLDSIRRQMRERERERTSMSRDMDAYCMDRGFSTAFADDDDIDVLPPEDLMMMEDYGGHHGHRGWRSMPKRPAAHLASHGRSLTQNEFQPPSVASARMFPSRRVMEEGDFGGRGGGAGGGGLDLRDRGDWRRVSVPERGQDFKSLPRKYNSR